MKIIHSILVIELEYAAPTKKKRGNQGRFIELGSAIRGPKREQRRLSTSFLLAAGALVSEDKSLLSLFHTL